MNALSLTAEEKKMFDGLSAKVKEGWEAQEEKGSYQDSPEKLSTRLALLRVHDPKLLEFQKKAAGLSAEKLSELIAKTDLTGVTDDDLAQLSFAIGPTILTRLIGGLLQAVKTDDDLEGIAALTVIRHSLLESFAKV